MNSSEASEVLEEEKKENSSQSSLTLNRVISSATVKLPHSIRAAEAPKISFPSGQLERDPEGNLHFS